MLETFMANTSLWMALVVVILLCVWLGVEIYPVTSIDAIDKDKKALAEKHEVLPLLVKVWSNLEGGKLYGPRTDIDHLLIRKRTHVFVMEYKGDTNSRKQFLEGVRHDFGLCDFPTEENSEPISEESIFEMTAALLSMSHRSAIEWLNDKGKVDIDLSVLLFKFQPALLKIDSILEDSKEDEIVLEIDTRKKIEDLLSPLLDGLYKMKLTEEKTSAGLIKSLRVKVNENYQKSLEKELILSGLRNNKRVM